MSEFPSNPVSSEKRPYSVSLWTDLKAYGLDLYEFVCIDHWQALALAISEHKAAGRPLFCEHPFLGGRSVP